MLFFLEKYCIFMVRSSAYGAKLYRNILFLLNIKFHCLSSKLHQKFEVFVL